MSASQSIGQRFTQLIQHLGMSKNAFAQSLDKTATVIQHLVEERNKPGYDLLCKVFEVYPNVSKDWLMQGVGPMMQMNKSLPEPAAPPATEPIGAAAATEPAVATQFSTIEPASVAVSPAPQPMATTAPVVAAAAPSQPAPTATMPATPFAGTAVTPAPAPAALAPAAVAAPDPAYFAVALQTQYLQHQLALAEQRNQHLLEQQALMQQLVAVLQRSSV